MSFFPGKRVAPYRLWIGSKRDSQNARAAERHGVTLIVNCTRNLPDVVGGVQHHRVPVDDASDEAPALLECLPETVLLIDDHLSRGGGVLVHCYAGISRSASTVAAYLMFKEGLTPRQAIARIKRLKRETFGDEPNFLAALEAFHAFLTLTTGTPAEAASRRG